MAKRIDRELRKGESVEVSITDEWWVSAEVISDMETRVSVKLLQPILWVERQTVIQTPLLWFLKPKIKEIIKSQRVETMTVSCLLVRGVNVKK